LTLLRGGSPQRPNNNAINLGDVLGNRWRLVLEKINKTACYENDLKDFLSAITLDANILSAFGRIRKRQ
jgi:hypothetical protein